MDSILIWFKSTSFYDYFNWYLAQPSSDVTGVVLVVGVVVIAVIVILIGSAK